MKPIRIGNLEFKCSHVGEQGPLVIFLHGYGGGPLDWHHCLPELSARHRLLIPNLTPLWSSPMPIGFAKQVEILAALMNELNAKAEPFVLVGSSYGGTLSFGLRAHFRSLVQGHVMINPMPLDPLMALKSGQLRMLFGLNMVPGALPLFLKSNLGKNLLLELGKVFGFGPDGRRGLNGASSDRKLILISKAVQRFAWIAQNENWSYWAAQLRDHVIPLLLITGNNDPLFLEKDFRAYQNLVPMSEHLPVQGAGHVLVRSHGPELGAHIREFIVSLSIEPTLTAQTLRNAV